MILKQLPEMNRWLLGLIASNILSSSLLCKSNTYIYNSVIYQKLGESKDTMCRSNNCHCWHDYPERGWIQFLMLRVLYEKPVHGYQLLEEIEQRSCGCHKLEPGSIYTLLRRMEERGLLESKWEKVEGGTDRRVYTVTVDGVEALRMGLESIVKRRLLFEDLARFYKEHFESFGGGER